MGAVAIRRVVISDAERIRAIRLGALRSDPSSFASTFAKEAAEPDEAWVDWATGDATGDEMATMLALWGDDAIGLVAAYQDNDDHSLYHVIAMWVAPEHRRAASDGSFSRRSRSGSLVRVGRRCS